MDRSDFFCQGQGSKYQNFPIVKRDKFLHSNSLLTNQSFEKFQVPSWPPRIPSYGKNHIWGNLKIGLEEPPYEPGRGRAYHKPRTGETSPLCKGLSIRRQSPRTNVTWTATPRGLPAPRKR